MPQGHGKRCAGFLSADREWEHCQREQHAGRLELDERTTPPTFAHKLRGECRCGKTHGPAPLRPLRVPQARPRREEHRYAGIDAKTNRKVGEHVRIDIYDASGKRERKVMFWEPKGVQVASLALHNAPALERAKAAGKPVTAIVCEGEHTCDELNRALRESGRDGVIAVGTMTGASVTPCDDALRALLGCDVVLWQDNDADGRRHMERIAERLQAMNAPPPKWVAWRDAPAKGDAADYFARGGTVEGMLRLVTEQRRSPDGEGAHTSDEHLSEWDGGELLSEVAPERIEWLWDGYIPLRKLTVGDGDPGLGKTMLFAADLAARVTTGRAMPDGTPGIPGGAGVVIFTAEDDPADTLQPRLVAAGGDLKRVLVVTTIRRPDPDSEAGAMIERLPTFADRDFIERKIKQVGAKLVIFDPFMAYLPSTVNSFRDQDVRSALAPLARLAQETGAAFVLIRHLNKGNFANALYRGGGSIGIIGAARSGLLVVKDPDDENVRLFGQTKSNLGRSMPSWTYRVAEDDHGVPHIQWEGQSERSAADLLNVSSERDTTSKLETACSLLREELADAPRPEAELESLAKAQGISRATLRRAKKMLDVLSDKVGVGKDGYWVWKLPTASKGAHEAPEGAHTHGDEHLSANAGYKPARQADSAKGAHVDGYEHLSGNDERLSASAEGEEWNL